MYQKYNQLLRALSEEDGDVCMFTNRYPTTLACIVSGILKLCRVAEMPEGAEVFRGLSGLVLPPSFFEKDEQGFAGGVDPGFMPTTTDLAARVVDLLNACGATLADGDQPARSPITGGGLGAAGGG